jgi:hypothetical protein
VELDIVLDIEWGCVVVWVLEEKASRRESRGVG